MLVVGLIFSFLLGLLLGSGIDVLVYWMYDHSSFGERWNCPTCVHPQRIRHRVPLLSWFFQQGHCDHCGRRIQFRFPWMELIMAVLTVFTYHQFVPFLLVSDVVRFVLQLLMFFALLVCTSFDARWKLLPLEFIGVMTMIFFLMNLIFLFALPFSLLIASGFGGGFLGLQFLVSRGRWMGGGDVALGLMIGAALGWPLIGVSYYFTYVVGGLGLLMAFLLGMIRMQSRIAFAPLLSGGAILAVFIGDRLLEWVRGIIG